MRKIGNRARFREHAAPATRPREELLYVEDDDDNWHVAELRLGDRYTLTRAANAREACTVLRSRGKNFVAVLMDVELRDSDLNGMELTAVLRGLPPGRDLPLYAAHMPVLRAPIIFVTAHGREFANSKLDDLGGECVISKPVDFNALNLAITQGILKRVIRRPHA